MHNKHYDRQRSEPQNPRLHTMCCCYDRVYSAANQLPLNVLLMQSSASNFQQHPVFCTTLLRLPVSTLQTNAASTQEPHLFTSLLELRFFCCQLLPSSSQVPLCLCCCCSSSRQLGCCCSLLLIGLLQLLRNGLKLLAAEAGLKGVAADAAA
jgi:hypothetical protein